MKNDDIVVWVDPLDGTSEYTQGRLDHVTVLVGISVKGRAIGGVIHQPYYNYKTNNPLGRTIWGLIGIGIGGLVPQQLPTDRLIITTTRSHSDSTVVKALEALNPHEIIKVGGAGHKVHTSSYLKEKTNFCNLGAVVDRGQSTRVRVC